MNVEPRDAMPEADLNTQPEIETNIEMDEEIEPTDYLVLKFTFVPTRGNVGGALCLIFEGATGEIISQQLWVTRPYIPKALTVKRDWRNFIDMFARLGPYYAPFGEKLSYLLPDLLSEEDRMDLFEEAARDDKRQLASVTLNLRKGFEKATLCFFDVDSDVELVTRSELEQAKLLEPLEPSTPAPVLEDTPTDEVGEDPTASMLIRCHPIIDPIGGKSASEIVPGDVVEVEIVDEGVGAGAVLRQFLEKKGMTPTFPVQKITRSGERATIYLRINDELGGIMSASANLRLKMKTEQIPYIISTATLERLVGDIFYFTILGGIVILFISVLRILLM